MARTHDFVLGVDLDNVTANYTDGLRRVVAMETGMDPETLNDPTSWGHYGDWGLTEQGYFDMHRIAVSKYRMFSWLDPIPGAADVLRELSEQGVRVRIVTHRLYDAGMHEIVGTDTFKWLDKHNVPFWDVCFVARKADVGVDLLIDDAPHNIEAMRAVGRDVLTYDWAYNAEIEGPRVKDWQQIRSHVLKLL